MNETALHRGPIGVWWVEASVVLNVHRNHEAYLRQGKGVGVGVG